MEQAVGLRPDYSDAWNLYGVILRRRGELHAAVSAYHKAVDLDPSFAEAWNNLGVALQQAGAFIEAAQAYSQAVTLQPDLAETHHNLAAVLRAVGENEQAYRHAVQAIELRPDFVEAYVTLGRIFLAAQDFTAAVATLRTAVTRGTRHPGAYFYLASALESIGRVDEAADNYRQAFELRPNYVAALDGFIHQKQHLCDWADIDRLSSELICFVDSQSIDQILDDHSDLVSPFSFLTLPAETTPLQQLRCARRWSNARRNTESFHPSYETLRGKLGSFVDRKIRVGYLSADYHAHATAWLIAEWLESHDRKRFEVFGYSYGPDDDSPIRRRLMNAFDTNLDLRTASHRSAACQIRNDRIDILVDLKGYTQFARPEIMAYRPAPIQINYLGYPGTMGADFIDFILADEFVVPRDQENAFSEKVLRVPGCYQANDRTVSIGEATTRAVNGLPDAAFVFCCFNSPYKITPTVFDVWMRLLEAVPDAVLWLLAGHPVAEANLRREADRRGIEPNRLVFAQRASHDRHLSRLRLADLFLDTFPVTAHTTASDALRVGLPLITLSGQAMVSRVAGSLLHSVGSSSLIAANLNEYESIAMGLARDRIRLAELKKQLAADAAVSPTFSGQAFADKVSFVYESLFRELFSA